MTYRREAAGAGTSRRPSRSHVHELANGPVWHSASGLAGPASLAAFEHERSFTVGVEEELILVDSATYELVPGAADVLAVLRGDDRFAPELRPAQLESVTRVCATAADACRELSAARRDLLVALGARYRVLGSGTHPFSRSWGDITQSDRYRQIADEYTWAAQRSLACGLHIHVAVGGADRALAVYNALRSFLPELAALAANSPFFEGCDIGMASVRPKLNEAFPRSGVPPAFRTWDDLFRFNEWGRSGGLFPDPTHFWWDLRPHLTHGTLEIRVADTQTRVADAAALVALVQALVVWLAERHDAGEQLPFHETYWISENAWRAHRHGVRGWLVDLDTGRQEPTRERLARLIAELEPYAARFDALDELAAAQCLLAGNGADRQRHVHSCEGIVGLTRWLAAETERSSWRD